MRAFLSHSSRDKFIVEEVAELLDGSQLELDSATFDGGLINSQVILDVLRRSSLFVLFLTEDALKSAYVRFEAISARELVARGRIEKFVVICLDNNAFLQADGFWKDYAFVRHLRTSQSIARYIQQQLVLDRARGSSRNSPQVERSKELNQVKEDLIDPKRPPTTGFYISGNNGIGRRTFARRIFQDRYPEVNTQFPEIDIESLDGYEEIYRKVSEQLAPTRPISNLRANFLGFSIANEEDKANQIASMLNSLAETREALILRDAAGLLDNDGALQLPLSRIIQRVKKKAHPSLIFIAQRMMPHRQRTDQGIVYCSLPSMSDDQIRQLAGFLLKDAEIAYDRVQLDQITQLSDGHPFNVKMLVEAARDHTLSVALSDVSDLSYWKHKRGSEFLRNIQFSEDEGTLLGALKTSVLSTLTQCRGLLVSHSRLQERFLEG